MGIQTFLCLLLISVLGKCVRSCEIDDAKDMANSWISCNSSSNGMVIFTFEGMFYSHSLNINFSSDEMNKLLKLFHDQYIDCAQCFILSAMTPESMNLNKSIGNISIPVIQSFNHSFNITCIEVIKVGSVVVATIFSYFKFVNLLTTWMTSLGNCLGDFIRNIMYVLTCIHERAARIIQSDQRAVIITIVLVCLLPPIYVTLVLNGRKIELEDFDGKYFSDGPLSDNNPVCNIIVSAETSLTMLSSSSDKLLIIGNVAKTNLNSETTKEIIMSTHTPDVIPPKIVCHSPLDDVSSKENISDYKVDIQNQKTCGICSTSNGEAFSCLSQMMNLLSLSTNKTCQVLFNDSCIAVNSTLSIALEKTLQMFKSSYLWMSDFNEHASETKRKKCPNETALFYSWKWPSIACGLVIFVIVLSLFVPVQQVSWNFNTIIPVTAQQITPSSDYTEYNKRKIMGTYQHLHPPYPNFYKKNVVPTFHPLRKPDFSSPNHETSSSCMVKGSSSPPVQSKGNYKDNLPDVNVKLVRQSCNGDLATLVTGLERKEAKLRRHIQEEAKTSESASTQDDFTQCIFDEDLLVSGVGLPSQGSPLKISVAMVGPR